MERVGLGSPWSTPGDSSALEPSALKSAETAALVAARRRAAAILAEAEVDERRAARSEATASGAPAPELGKSGTDGDLRSLVQKQIALEELDANSGIIHPGAVLGEDANALDRWRQRQFNVGWTDIVRGANERSLHPAAGYKPLNETRRPGWWGAGLLGTACYANESLDIESRESMRTFALALALPCLVLGRNTSALREEKKVQGRRIAGIANYLKLGFDGTLQALCCACVPLHYVHCFLPLPYSPCLMYATIRQRRRLMQKYGMKTMSPCCEIYVKGMCYPCAIAQHAVFLQEQRLAVKKANAWQKRQGLQRMLRVTQNPGAHIIFEDRDITVDFLGNEQAQTDAEKQLRAASQKEMDLARAMSKEQEEAEEARREADAAAAAAAEADMQALIAAQEAVELDRLKDGALSFLEGFSGGSVKANKDAPMTEDEAARLIQRCIKRRRARVAIEKKRRDSQVALQKAQEMAAEAAAAEHRAQKEEREAEEAREALAVARRDRDELKKKAKERRRSQRRASRAKKTRQVRRQSFMQRMTFGRFGSDLVEEVTDEEESSTDEEDEEDLIVPLTEGSAGALWHTATLAEHTNRVSSMVFCDHRLVTASYDHSVRIWCKYKSSAEDDETGRMVVSRLWETEKVLQLDDLATGLCNVRMNVYEGGRQDVLFVATASNCVHAYASKGVDDRIPAWSRVAMIRLGSRVLCMCEHKSVKNNSFDSHLVLGMEDGAIHFFNCSKPFALDALQDKMTEYPQPDGTMTGHFGPVYSLCSVSPTTLVSGSSDGSIRVWRERGIKHLLRVDDFDDDGNVKPEFMYVYHMESKQVLAGSSNVVGGAWCAIRDTNTRFIVGDDANLRAFEAPSEDGAFELSEKRENAHKAALTCLTRAGPYVLSAGQDGMVNVYARRSLHLRKPVDVHTGPVWSVLVDHEGTQMFSAGKDTLVHICEPSKPDMAMDANDRARMQLVPARRRRAAIVFGQLRPEAELAAMDIQRIWRGAKGRSAFLVIFKENQEKRAREEAKRKKMEDLEAKHPETMQRLARLGLL